MICPKGLHGLTTDARSICGVSDGARVEVYECSGLRLASSLPLSAPKSVDDDPATADAQIVIGEERGFPSERPSDEVIAEFVEDDFPYYTFCRVGDGIVGRMGSVGDFEISGDLSKVVCHPYVGGRHHLLPVIIPGAIAAFLMNMAGQFVLHGSAVDIDGRALAFVGQSGQGKSTMAALFCAAGAALVTDDVLPLVFTTDSEGRGSVDCLKAGTEIRLREGSTSLIERFTDEVEVRDTVDLRRAVSPLTTGRDRIPLGAIIVPHPDHHHPEVAARLLKAGEANFLLGRHQRIQGWRDAEQLRRQFEDAGRVAGAVPVFDVSVPWGPPFADDLVADVLEACDLTDAFGQLESTNGPSDVQPAV
jgi:hypothetical protein